MCKPISPRPAPIGICPIDMAVPITIISATTAAIRSMPVKQAKKGVSFLETVDVYVVDRLDAFAIRDLYYRPSDYRRFRSESCQEILEAKANAGQPALTAVVRAVLANLVGSQQKQTLASRPLSYRLIQQRQQQKRPQSFSCASQLQQRSSPESLLRELSFAI